MHTKKYFHIHQSFFFLLLIIYTVEPSEKLSKTSTFLFFPLNPNRNHQDSPQIGMQKYTIYRR